MLDEAAAIQKPSKHFVKQLKLCNHLFNKKCLIKQLQSKQFVEAVEIIKAFSSTSKNSFVFFVKDHDKVIISCSNQDHVKIDKFWSEKILFPKVLYINL